MFFFNYSATFLVANRYGFFVTVRPQFKLAKQIGKNMGNQSKLRRTLIIEVYLLIFN